MANVVCGVMASHTTLMNTRWDEVAHLDGPNEFKRALGAARAAIEQSEADVAVVIGPNHFRGFWLDLMPAFTIGVGAVAGAGEHGTPKGPLPVDPELAHHLLEGVMAAGFDPAMSADLQVDHGITHAVQYVVPDGMPVVPLIVNSFAPPLPSLSRCTALGTALGAALHSFAGARSVAVVASGGLSHALPFPDWRAPGSDDDRFLVDSWLHGREDWARYEARRRSIVVGAPARINEAFDAELLAAFAAGDLAAVVAQQHDLIERAGNGANEIRNWLIAAAACGAAPARTLAYAPVQEWLTGMGVAVVDRPVHPPVPEVPR